MSIESSQKILEYINRVSKVPMIVDGQPFGNPPVSSVTLRKSFYLKDSCEMCGKCCPNETTVWTSEGFHRILTEPEESFLNLGLNLEIREKLLKNLSKTEMNVNGKSCDIFTHPSDSGKAVNKLSWSDRAEVKRCHWLFEKDGTHRCSIHPIRSVTCGLPHVRFLYSRRTNQTFIGTVQFGRNFALKCPITFTEFDEASVQVKIMWLKRLRDCANDLGVDTFLSEIIDYLDKGGRDEVTFSIPHHKKLF